MENTIISSKVTKWEENFSTTEVIRHAIEAYADEPVIISVPIGGDVSEFE